MKRVKRHRKSRRLIPFLLLHRCLHRQRRRLVCPNHLRVHCVGVPLSRRWPVVVDSLHPGLLHCAADGEGTGHLFAPALLFLYSSTSTPVPRTLLSLTTATILPGNFLFEQYARASDLAQSRKKPLLAAYILFSVGCLIS